jgi:hypothetical protein
MKLPEEVTQMAHHEQRLAPGDPTEGPLNTVNVYVDDEGNVFYPGQDGYVEPEPGNAEFLQDFGQQLADDQHRVASGQAVTMPVDEQEATIQAAEEATDPNAPQPQSAPPSGQPQAAQPQPVQQPNVQQQQIQTQAQAQAQQPQAKRGRRSQS